MLQLCDWITNDSTCNLNHSSLIMNCRTLASLIPQAKICHCLREANKCADALARKGPSIQQDFYFIFDSPLVDIAMLLFSDFSGVYYERICPHNSVASL